MAIAFDRSIRGVMSIRGGEELAAALEALGPTMEKKILRSAMREAAKPMLADAKRRAPVLTGQLRKSLKIRAMKRRSKGQVGVVISTAKGFFKGDEFYGAFHEFGTKRMPARPFIRPAFEANKAQSIRIVGEAIKIGLEDITSGKATFRKVADVSPGLLDIGANP